MDQPARQGHFGVTTRIIHKTEGRRITLQQARVEKYQKLRRCFGVGDETQNLSC